jgi:hypothetical protein
LVYAACQDKAISSTPNFQNIYFLSYQKFLMVQPSFFFSMTRNPSKVGHFVYPLLLSKPWTRVKHPLHTDKIFNGPTKMMDVSLSSLLYQTKKINQKSTMHLKKPRIIVLQHFKTQGKFSPTRRERCSER